MTLPFFGDGWATVSINKHADEPERVLAGACPDRVEPIVVDDLPTPIAITTNEVGVIDGYLRDLVDEVLSEGLG